MAKQTKPTQSTREGTTAVISRDLASKIKVIASHHEETMLETLDRIAGPAVLREFRKVVEEMDQERHAATSGG